MQRSLDNVDIAILSKLNDLAERRGLKPYDFVAVYGLEGSELKDWVLRFEEPVRGNNLREERYGKMLRDLGIDPLAESIELKGTPQTIVDALDHALSISPKPRPRG
jgi:hypothetical protein